MPNHVENIITLKGDEQNISMLLILQEKYD